VTVTASESEAAPSDTVKVTVETLCPCASDGVQVSVPVTVPKAGVDEKVAPEGSPVAVSVRVCPVSRSVAVTVKVSVDPSLAALAPIVASTGGLFTGVSVTVIVISSKSEVDPSETVILAW